MANEYTTITVDMTRIDSTAPNGTLYAELSHVVTLANNDVVYPEKRAFTVTSGAASISLACTATAIKNQNAAYVISFAPTGQPEKVLGRIIPTASASPMNLSDLLEVGATAVAVNRTVVGASNIAIFESLAALRATSNRGNRDLAFVIDVGWLRCAGNTGEAELGSLIVSDADGKEWYLEDSSIRTYPTVYNAGLYGAVGDGVTVNTTALQAWIDAVPATGGIAYLPPGTYLSGNLQISSKANLVITGPGKLKWTGTASGSDSIGIQLLGTCTNITIDGLRMEGDGVAASRHAGVWSYTGQTHTNIRVLNCHITDVVLGISVASTTGALIHGNCLDNIVGTASGQGYGIHSDTNTDVRISDNMILRAQRHSIYQGRGSKILIANNTVRRHREGLASPGSPLSAIAIARSTEIVIANNILDSCKDGSIGIEGSRTDAGVVIDCRNVVVSNNVITNPTGTNYAIFIGDQDVSADHARTDNVSIEGNVIYQTEVGGATPIQIYTGRRIKIANNTIYREGMEAGNSLIQLRGVGETSGTATYTDEIEIRGNVLRGVGTGGGSTGGNCIELFGASGPTSGASTSGITIRASNNHIDVPDDSWNFATAQTNPNIYVLDTPTDGLDVDLAKGTTGIFGAGFVIQDLAASPNPALRGATGSAPRWSWRIAGSERAYIEYDDAATDFRMDSDTTITLAANNGDDPGGAGTGGMITIPTTMADGEVGLLVRRNVGGTYSMQRVSLGTADSGGAGYKLLRVEN